MGGRVTLSHHIGVVPLMSYVFRTAVVDANDVGGIAHASLDDELKPREAFFIFQTQSIFTIFYITDLVRRVKSC